MNPSASDMLPPQATASLIRSGGSPGMLFQQNPLVQNQTPGSASYDPGLANQPQVGSQQAPPPMQPMTQAGQEMQSPQISEAELILNALMKRLEHHSSITSKTVNTIAKMIDANASVQSNSPEANSLNYQIDHGA